MEKELARKHDAVAKVTSFTERHPTLFHMHKGGTCILCFHIAQRVITAKMHENLLYGGKIFDNSSLITAKLKAKCF